MTARPAWTETRLILSLAWPVVLTGLNWTILHVTDVAVVGLAGTGEAAALGASRTLTFPGIVVGVGALTGILVFAARADGAGDLRESGRVLHRGLALALLLGIASMAVLGLAPVPMLALLGVEPHVIPAAAQVVRVMALAYPFQLVILAASFFLEGVSRPSRVTVVNLAVLPINAVLAWALATGQAGLPAMGATGAALATAIASALGAVGMIAAVWTLPQAAARGVRDLADLMHPRILSGAMELLRFGAVPAIGAALELVGFSILIALSTQLGAVAAHAFQIVFSIHNVTFAVALGLGSAAGVRAGNAVGEGVPEQARGRTLVAAAISAVATGALSLAILFFTLPLARLFPATAPVHADAAAMLLVWAPFILFDGVQIVFVYALRSLSDQVVAGVNGIVAYFLVTGGLGILTVHAGWGQTGLALASGLGMVAAALLHGGRFLLISRRSRWRS